MFNSLAIGKFAEQELVDYLKSIGMNAEINTVHELRYDFDVKASLIDDLTRETTFEAKNDLMATKTGNVAIEYQNTKSIKPSGIYVTKAKWWVHKINDILWICEVEKLINFTKSEKADKMITGGGDKNANLFIYRVDRFTDICRDLKTITNPEDFIL